MLLTDTREMGRYLGADETSMTGLGRAVPEPRRSTLAASAESCTQLAAVGVEPVARKMLPLEAEEGHIMSLTTAATLEVDESVRTILRERARRRVMVLFALILAFSGFAVLISLMYLD